MYAVSNTVMSLNGVSNTVFPNTLNGLDSLDVTNITIDGQSLASLFVPYTGAQSNVDLNAKSLTGVNSISASAVTSSGLVQGANVTATALTTTDTLKINTVSAGTTAKYLATNAAGNVIEADITTKYVPYTGATAHVNLNAKNLSNVLTYSGTNVQVTSTETTSLLATGTTQLNTLRITNVGIGTQTQLLAVDATGNVINGTVSVPTTFDVTVITTPTDYYPIFVNGTTGGVRALQSDNGFQTISYNTGTRTLSTYQLKLLNVPAGTQTSILAVDSAGNVIQGTTPAPTQLLTTEIPAGSIPYYPALISSQATGNKSYFNENSANTGNMSFQAPVLTTGLGTWYIPQLVINNAITLYNARFSATPSITPIGSVSYALGLNATNDVIAYVPSNQVAVTATTSNSDFNLLFTATSTSNPNITVNIDSGTNLKYNPATDTLTVPIITVGTSATIAGASLTGTPTAPTAAPGTNTTQIATTAFVTAAVSAVSGYLPLTGGTMTGSITYANTALTPITLSSANLTAYTYSIRDSFWTLPMLEFTTKTLSTSGSVSFGVPIVITNTSSTNLITLPYNASTAYTKYILNTGGDIFMSFTGRTTSPAANGSVVFGSSIPVSINDTLSMNPAAAGILCNTYKNVSNATLQIQGFWSGANSGIRFDANASDSSTLPGLWGTLNNNGWTFYNGGSASPIVIGKIISDNIGWRLGSMFDFSLPGTWDASNSLYVTTGGIGSTNSGVGIGYNTTFDSGLLVSIAPNVAWKPMRYKANQHDFYVGGNTPMGGFNPFGVYANNAGYMTNSVGAAAAGLSGIGTGDLVFYANAATQVMRWFTGTSQRLVLDSAGGLTFGTSGVGLQTITGSPYGSVSTYGNNGWNGYDINRRWCLMGWNANTEAGFHDNVYSWIWRTTANNFIVDRPSVIYTNVSQQTYQSYQVLMGSNNNTLQWGVIFSTYYQNNTVAWGGGVQVAYVYKASATSVLRCSGAASYYVGGGGMYLTRVNFYNYDIGVAYIVTLNQFTNNASNHVSFPIMAQYAGLPVGTYGVIVSTNGITDGNDHLYLLSEICFG